MRRPCPTNLRQTIVSNTCKHQAHDGSHFQDTCCTPARMSYHAGGNPSVGPMSASASSNIVCTCSLRLPTSSKLDQKNVHNDANPMKLHAPTVRIQKQPPKQTMARKREDVQRQQVLTRNPTIITRTNDAMLESAEARTRDHSWCTCIRTWQKTLWIPRPRKATV